MNAHGTVEVTTEAQTCKMLVMTSALNHEQTKQFFEVNNYFGANSDSLVFFQ